MCLSTKQLEDPESIREWISRSGIGRALNGIKHPESFLKRVNALRWMTGAQLKSMQPLVCAVPTRLLSIFLSLRVWSLRLSAQHVL